MTRKSDATKKIFAMIIVATLHIADIVPASALTSIIIPGTSDYIGLHSYVTTTDIENVYKVTQTISTPPMQSTQGPVYIAITLDYSSSMINTDIWDSTGYWSSTGTAGTITHYTALDAAVSAMIDSLVADGNKQIYLNFSTHDGNSEIATSYASAFANPGNTYGLPDSLYNLANASGFVSLYDPVTGSLRDVFDSTNSSTWFMKNWGSGYYSSGDGATKKLTNIGGWCGYFGSNDFAVPFRRIHGLFKNGLVNGTIPVNAARYILAMGDGTDTGATGTYSSGVSTMDWATALKAPLDNNFQSGGSTTAAQTIAGADGGIGATIWGVTVGPHTGHFSSYASDIMNGVAPWASSGAPTYGLYSEPRMIGSTMEIPSTLTLPSTRWGNSDTAITDYVNAYAAVPYLYTSLSNGPLKDTDQIHYTHSCFLDAPGSTSALSKGSSLLDAFGDFGTAAAAAADSTRAGLTTISTFNSMYLLYQYKSEPLVALSSTDPATVQSYSISGNSVAWNIESVDESSTLTMVYYVYFDATSADSDLYYSIFTSTPLTFMYGGEEYTILFPQVYVKGSGDSIKEDDAVTANVTDSSSSIDTNSWESGYGLTASYGIPYGTSTQPYTASVTPAPTVKEEVLEVEQEVLEEDTILVPATGTGLYVLIVLAASLSLGLYVSIKKRNK